MITVANESGCNSTTPGGCDWTVRLAVKNSRDSVMESSLIGISTNRTPFAVKFNWTVVSV